MELLIYGPEGSSTTVSLKKQVLSLGRSADNDLAYPSDPWLSRYHLKFQLVNGAWMAEDCNSRNGTILNAASLKEPRPVSPGDRIYAGHLTIEVRDSVETNKRLVDFVPRGQDVFERQATVVTNLEKVLRQTSDTGKGKQAKNPTLYTSRAVNALIRAGQQLAGHRPLGEVFEIILDLAMSAVDAMRGVILVLESGDLEVAASKGDGFSISTSLRDRVLREKNSLMISDAQLDDALREQKSIVAHKVHSVMAVPLQTGDRVIGLIYVDTGNIISPFSQEDLDLLTVMANVAAIRIEHARLALVEQSEKLMESELSQASEIQISLLPSAAPTLPGYDLAGFNLPCRTVGGDYYDFLPYRDGRMGLVVGDVSGKGMAAALMMSSLQARVHMLSESSPEPAPAVTALNRNVAARCPLGKFITFFYAILEPRTGRLSYSNAGHNYPLLVCADGSAQCLLGNGMVLGIRNDSGYQTEYAQLERGDMLALFSDGVTEARGEGTDEEFGDESLAKFLAPRRDKPASETINELVDYLRDWTGQASFADDFTMMLVRRI